MLLEEKSDSLLGILLGVNDIIFDVGGKVVTEGLSLHEDSVMLVLRLSKA